MDRLTTNKQHPFLILLSVMIVLFPSCRALKIKSQVSDDPIPTTGSAFYRQATSYGWKERDSLALQMFETGQIPQRFLKLVTITSRMTDSSGKTWKARLQVTQDYFMVGTRRDFARVPITPMAAQNIADQTHTALPTRKMVDLIHLQARVRLDPVPLYAHRDSTVIMRHHDLIIEGQRKGKNGLISGIKKDVVLSSKNAWKDRTKRVAIYGWHKSDGKPIQPLYTGHVDWYVDYSHGIRLIDRKVRVNGRRMDYLELLNHSKLRGLVSDEPGEMMLRY
ncbi:MAG: hypothetical protein ACK5VH_04645 [bacterium]|jgi:hypothetical protein